MGRLLGCQRLRLRSRDGDVFGWGKESLLKFDKCLDIAAVSVGKADEGEASAAWIAVLALCCMFYHDTHHAFVCKIGCTVWMLGGKKR